MKKLLFMAATAALALTSCSSEEELAQDPIQKGDVPVAFDSYMVRSTRANTYLTGMDDVTDLVKGIKNTGFGVYAYEHGTEYIEDYTKKIITPNFFSNEKVTFDSGTNLWTYGDGTTSYTKYWPNNEGAMLSFYAYAAYDANLKHEASDNPCRLIYNGAYNGPAIQYTMPEDLTKAVDLCWGAEYGEDLAPVNKTKPSVTDKVKFNFKHAMARYGFNVQVWSDQVTDNWTGDTEHDPAGSTNQAITTGTTIKITSVKLVGNFAKNGILRLYDGKWDAQTALTGEYELKENFGKKVRAGLKDSDAKNEIPLLGDETSENENLYVMMIPGAKFQIQIDYEVITPDDKLVGYDKESRIKNSIISKEVFTAEPGKAVDFHLNLGMTTVKFDAVVTEWETAITPSDPTDEVDLPANAMELVNFTAIDEVSNAPQNIASMFIGEAKTDPTVDAAGKVYWNTTTSTLMLSDGPDSWTEAAKVTFVVNNTIYSYETSAWVKTAPAPKFVKCPLGYYELVSNEYVAIAFDETTYASDINFKNIVRANPATGIYKVGSKYYYYKKY